MILKVAWSRKTGIAVRASVALRHKCLSHHCRWYLHRCHLCRYCLHRCPVKGLHKSSPSNYRQCWTGPGNLRHSNFTWFFYSLLPTGIFGIPEPRKSALLIGRYLTSFFGLFVIPGIIDSDFFGEIKIMAWTPFPPWTVPQGIRIAQLIPFSNDLTPIAGEHKEGVGGSSSTGTPQILWVQTISNKCPTCTLLLQGQQITLTGVLDTGSDVTVTSLGQMSPHLEPHRGTPSPHWDWGEKSQHTHIQLGLWW